MARGRGRGKQSRYGAQLEEKRNLKNMFGIREAQLRRYFRIAAARNEETGPYLIAMLELRLDNALFRAGVAETRPQARQMAAHKLVEVNGRVVNVPSVQLKVGDVVRIKESKRSKSYFQSYEKRLQNVQTPEWIEHNTKEYSFKIVGRPVAEEARLGVDTQAVVEMLSR